jgi:hypothetical protein
MSWTAPLHPLVHHPIDAHVSRHDVDVALHVVPKWGHQGAFPRDAASSPVGLSHYLLNYNSLRSPLRYMDMTLENIKGVLVWCPMLLSLYIGYIFSAIASYHYYKNSF